MRSDPSSTRRWLRDIRSQIVLVQQFLGDRDYEAFRVDQLCFYAVTRCLEIISEASRRLPEDLKARHPSIPWKEMAGAGNVYRHVYESVEPDDVWVTIQDHLLALRAVVDAELAAVNS
jgi:uncharacterized protein with HEPN domain